MNVPQTLRKAWRWVRQDVPEPDLNTLETPPLVEWLKDHETAAKRAPDSGEQYLRSMERRYPVETDIFFDRGTRTVGRGKG